MPLLKLETSVATADQKLEHHWADLLEQAHQFRIPIPRSALRITAAAVQATCFTPSAAPNLSGFDKSLRNGLLMSKRNDMYWLNLMSADKEIVEIQ